jgi:hypothetical protein
MNRSLGIDRRLRRRQRLRNMAVSWPSELGDVEEFASCLGLARHLVGSGFRRIEWPDSWQISSQTSCSDPPATRSL